VSFFFSVLTSDLELYTSRNRLRRLVVAGYRSTSTREQGLFAVDPEDGREVWRRQLPSAPTAHRCSPWPGGGPDCLVVGDRGLLAGVSADEGAAQFWEIISSFPLFFQANWLGCSTTTRPWLTSRCPVDCPIWTMTAWTRCSAPPPWFFPRAWPIANLTLGPI